MSYSSRAAGFSFYSYGTEKGLHTLLCAFTEEQLRSDLDACFKEAQSEDGATREDFDYVVSRFLGDLDAERAGDKYWFLKTNLSPLPAAVPRGQP